MMVSQDPESVLSIEIFSLHVPYIQAVHDIFEAVRAANSGSFKQLNSINHLDHMPQPLDIE